MTLYGLRCALYARRSKEEHQAASIEVQTGEARAWIAAQGGTLDPAHVYIDGDHGRAEFKKRPGLIAMLNAAGRRAFDAVIVRDESRLGGDANRTSLFIQDLLDHGARLFFYFTGEEVTIEGAVDRFMINVRNFASELEREKISQRTHEHLRTKARRGLNVGGRCYGYDNVEIRDGDRRVRVEYRINETQATIVREIFTRYAAGDGLRTIAKDLNTRGVPTPRRGARGTGSWSYAAIFEMVRRERYAGKLVWGKAEKTYRGGTRVRVARAPSEWITTDAPHLRIVDEVLWAKVAAKVGQSERGNGSACRGAPPRYLLTGLARCAVCGGPMVVSNAKVSYDNVRVYGCGWHRDRGNTVCPNALRRPVASVDATLIETVQAKVLQGSVVQIALREVRRGLSEQAREASAATPAMEAEARKLRAEIVRLGEAIVSTTEAPAALVRMMAARETRLAAIEARLSHGATAPNVVDLEVRRMEQKAKRRLDDLGAMLARSPNEGRQVLETLLRGPLTFAPTDTAEGRRFQIEGLVGLDSMFMIEGVPSGTPAKLNTAFPLVLRAVA